MSLPEGEEEDVLAGAHDVQIDDSKSHEVLGIWYHDMEAMAISIVEHFPCMKCRRLIIIGFPQTIAYNHDADGEL